MSRKEAQSHLAHLDSWKISSNGKIIYREYSLKNFMSAVRLINQIAQIAEAENHHPDLHLVSYRNLRVELSTHALKGLTENDFILAAKIDELPTQQKAK